MSMEEAKLQNLIVEPVIFFCALQSIRDCSLFIGSTGPVFWGTGKGLFLMLPSTGHKDFLCFYGTGHELFLGKKSLKLYFIDILTCRVC